MDYRPPLEAPRHQLIPVEDSLSEHFRQEIDSEVLPGMFENAESIVGIADDQFRVDINQFRLNLLEENMYQRILIYDMTELKRDLFGVDDD